MRGKALLSLNMTQITGPCAWHGNDVLDNPDWQLTLAVQDIKDIESALLQCNESSIDWQQVTREQFPVAHLQSRLGTVAHQLEHGLGMVRLSGLPVDRYKPDDLRKILVGIGVHLGTPLFQNPRGEILGEIADEGPNVGRKRGQMVDKATGQEFLSSRSRVQSTAALRWHTDRCDVVGLLCEKQASVGGHSRLCSSVMVHNLMVERQPELAAVLYADVPRSRLGEEKGGELSYYPLPVFAVHEGRFTSHYSRTFIEACHKHESMPDISNLQWQALDLLAEISAECAFEMTLQPGDIQLLNNHVIYHARDAFQDGDQVAEKRKIHRIWLSMPNSRALPQGFEILWGKTEAGALRGGMCQSPLSGEGIQSAFSEPGERVPSVFL